MMAEARKEVFRFGIVGLLATGVHGLVYTQCVGPLHASALIANSWGFCCGFLVSFAGHSYWTFARRIARRRNTRMFLRFLLVALMGYLSNSGMTWLLVDHWHLPPNSALAGILFVTPFFVFLASRHWAFGERREAPS